MLSMFQTQTAMVVRLEQPWNMEAMFVTSDTLRPNAFNVLRELNPLNMPPLQLLSSRFFLYDNRFVPFFMPW